MGLATEAGEAVSNAVNALCALLQWNDAGAAGAPPVDGATLKRTMNALEEAMREILYGGQIVGAETLVTEAARERVVLLEEAIAAWPSTGALSSEVVTLAEACVSASWGGVGWRDLMANPTKETMSTNEPEECDDRTVDLMSNFGMGLGLLMALAEPNAATGSREETLETFAAFEAAYGPLAAQTDRRFELTSRKRRATVVLSDESFERVKRLGALLRRPPESAEAEGAAAEIRALAEECLRTLAPEAAQSGEPPEPT